MINNQVPQQLGKYKVLEEIGRGGFAAVHKAQDVRLERFVALKVLAPHWTWDRSFVERFGREARLGAKLRHPNIVTIYEAEEENGQVYIAMEYLEGRTLAQVLDKEKTLPLDRAVSILTQVADALDYAHGQKVIHRDVKPSNIMVEEDGQGRIHVTLMDFGLVKAMENAKSLTSTGTVLGSAEYMAPEQADPRDPDKIGSAADRYALGVVAYEMLTGRVPFRGPTSAVVHSQIYESPPDPRQFRADLSADASPVLLKALSKEPKDRYPTAMAMVEALQQASAPPKTVLKPRIWPALRQGRTLAIAGVLATVLLVGGMGLGKLLFASKPCPPATPIVQSIKTPTEESSAILTRRPTTTPTATRTLPAPTRTPTRRPTATMTSVPTPDSLLGTLAIQVPEGIILQDTRIYDGTTNELLDQVNGNGPFWLSPGTYTITLSAPFVGVSHGTVRMTSGQETSVDISQGTGKLSLQAPEGVFLAKTLIYDRATGSSLSSVNGSGPFWLPTGVYTITLSAPFVGVSHGGIAIREGEELSLDVRQGSGKLFFQAPEGISPSRTLVREANTGRSLGLPNGTGPFWLPAGTYTVTMAAPFVRVSHSGITVRDGEQVSLDVSQGTGKLSVQAPEGVSLGNTWVYDDMTGGLLCSVYGSGPFWLPTGVYTITLSDPFVGVSHGGITIREGEELSLDVRQGTGLLSLQSPEGVSPASTSVRDAATGKILGSANGSGPFWLPRGTYTVTMAAPFVGVSHGNVTVRSGEETVVDVTRGTGKLFIQAPEGISLSQTSVREKSTGRSLGSANGNGPFWLPTGTFTVTLAAPFVGISHGNVTVQSGQESFLDASQGAGRLLLQVPEGVLLRNTYIQDMATGKQLGTVNGSGPFWLPTGAYTVTLGGPLVRVSHGNVIVRAEEETSLDITQGTGKLSLQAPDGISLKSTSIIDGITNKLLLSVDGSGPFWLPTGAYTVTLSAPFARVSHGNVLVRAGEETALDVIQGTGTLSLQAPNGISLQNTSIIDGMTGKLLIAVNGNGPFWLPTGTYTVTPSAPFVGVSHGDVIIRGGEETSLDVTQ